jgi:peroxiredoxin
MAPGAQAPLRPGDRAPDFTLPDAAGDGTIALADYRGRAPVLLALFRGLYCSFCRRQLVALGGTSATLRAAGVETLAVVATPAERARRYFRLRQPRCTVAADAGLATFRAFRVPQVTITEEMMQAALVRSDELARERGLTLGPGGSPEALDRADGIDPHEFAPPFPSDQTLLTTEYLVDRDGVIRWASGEDLAKGPAVIGTFPSDEELLAAAKGLR